MFRLNFWAQSFMGHGGLPFSGAVDPRYVPPALPPPPMSMLYTSPPALLLPESLCRRPMIGFNDDSEKLSPELNDSVGTEAGRMGTTSPRVLGGHRHLDSAQSTSSASPRTAHQLSYPSLLLHNHLEALRHYQQQQQVRDDGNKSRPRCSTATESTARCDETSSAFHQPRRRRACTPDHISSDTDTGLPLIIAHENTSDTTSPVPLHTDDARSPARKAGINYFTDMS